MRIARGYVFSLGLLLPACGGGQVAPAESAPSATEVDAGQFPPVAATDAGLSDASATGNPPPVLDNDGGRVKGRAHDPGRSSQDIRALVVAHRDEARACYDNALATHPGIEGDLVMRWTIDPKGVVGQIANDTARSQISSLRLSHVSLQFSAKFNSRLASAASRPRPSTRSTFILAARRRRPRHSGLARRSRVPRPCHKKATGALSIKRKRPSPSNSAADNR